MTTKILPPESTGITIGPLIIVETIKGIGYRFKSVK